MRTNRQDKDIIEYDTIKIREIRKINVEKIGVCRIKGSQQKKEDINVGQELG